MAVELDLVSKLSEEDRVARGFALSCISPDDAKYGEKTRPLKGYLSAEAEWRTCCEIQRVLLKTRVEFGFVKQEHLDELDAALEKVDPLNIALLEDSVTMHDQLAVIEEIGRFVSPETKALLHPGTTSYDILDTARSYLFKGAWNDVIRPAVVIPIRKLCSLAEGSMDVLQAGRTHLQDTTPVPLGATFAGYAVRFLDRLKFLDDRVSNLRGKISGIVGTGAGIEMVVGFSMGLKFERAVLEKFGLLPDVSATQIVQKESLADVGHGLTTLMHVAGDLADDVRLLYSSAIGEMTSRDNADRLGGSSADATKNNPINYENIAGTPAIVEGGMRVLYEMINTDLQRDLRSSKQARYQPQQMMAQTFESFVRLGKTLGKLSINEDRIAENLQRVRDKPSEAMVTILRREGWVHTKYGVGHGFVKEMGKRSIREGRRLMAVALEDPEFSELYHEGLSDLQREILNGELEQYTGFSNERALKNIMHVRDVLDSP